MADHIYSTSERRAQLRELEAALSALVEALGHHPGWDEARIQYLAILERARQLLHTGWRQGDLSILAREVPELFWTHKDWTPPILEVSPGRWRVPAWFEVLEPLERRTAAAAERLRDIGRY